MIDKEKWQRYIDNRCTPKEKKEILQQLQGIRPADLKKMLGEGWEDTVPPMPVRLDQRLYSRLKEQMAQRQTSDQRDSPPRLPWRRPALRYWTAAAGFILLIGTALWLLKPFHPAKTGQAAVAAIRDIRNISGEVKIALLPDGSRVWLAPQSVITIQSDFNQKERMLQLQGEGYFEVAADPVRPFTVVSGDLRTSVLGTHFNIESYPGESIARVSLSAGKVAVQLPGSPVPLSLLPGQRITYRIDEKRSAMDTFSPAMEEEWKKGDFVLKDLPLADVFQRIALRFGKKIAFSSAAFKGRRFTGNYPHPDWKIVLDNLAYVQGFIYTVKADSIIIH